LAEFNVDFNTRQASIILRQIPYHVRGGGHYGWPVELECDAQKELL